MQKADPVARRQAVVLFILGAVVGALLIHGFERYRLPLHDWLLSEPGEVAAWLRIQVITFGRAITIGQGESLTG